jgi:hypothetical protein
MRGGHGGELAEHAGGSRVNVCSAPAPRESSKSAMSAAAQGCGTGRGIDWGPGLGTNRFDGTAE